jgi:hypothetical protein
VLQAEIALASGQGASALSLSTDMLDQVRRLPQPDGLRDLSARSLQVQGQAWLEMHRPARALQPLRQAVVDFTALYDAERSQTLANSVASLAHAEGELGQAKEVAQLTRQARAIRNSISRVDRSAASECSADAARH